jgi:hypothetical protein
LHGETVGEILRRFCKVQHKGVLMLQVHGQKTVCVCACVCNHTAQTAVVTVEYPSFVRRLSLL